MTRAIHIYDGVRCWADHSAMNRLLTLCLKCEHGPKGLELARALFDGVGAMMKALLSNERHRETLRAQRLCVAHSRAQRRKRAQTQS